MEAKQLAGRKSVELNPIHELHQRVIKRAKALINVPEDQGGVEREIARMVTEKGTDKSFSTVIQKIQDIYGELERAETEIGGDKVEAGVAAPVVALLECPACKNTDQLFFTNRKDGSVVCRGAEGRGCGEVVAVDQVFEGSMLRNFADNQDRNAFGPPQDPTFSPSYNLGTMVQGSAMRATKGKSGGQGKEVDFALAGKGGVRIEYKDDQKLKAFNVMYLATRNLRLHDSALNKAKIMFAAFRNARDRVQDFPSTVAACLIAAHLELLEEEGVGDGPGPRSFDCPQCNAVFNCKADCDRHLNVDHGIGVTQVSSDSIDDVPIQTWDADTIRQWLEGMSPRVREQAPAILEGLQEAVKMSHVIAGKELMVTGKMKMTRWCNGDEKAAGELYDAIQAIKNKRMLRQKLEQQERNDEMRKKQRKQYEYTMLGKGMTIS